MARAKREVKQTTVQLSAVTAAVIQGPGDDWLFVVRGVRRHAPASRKATRKARPRGK